MRIMEEQEIWAFCEVPFTRYQVSNLGRVKNTLTRKILTPFLHCSGYYSVNLWYQGKVQFYYVHRLVAMAFCEGYEEGKEINHIDGDKFNNKASNLEWVFHKENMEHSTNELLRACCPLVLMKDAIHLEGIYKSVAEVKRLFGGSPHNNLARGLKFRGYIMKRISVGMYKEMMILLSQGYTLNSAWIEASTNIFIDRET